MWNLIVNYYKLLTTRNFLQHNQITCIRFAPNAPAQNPVEDVWLQAKRFIREFYHLCKSFFAVKRLFELGLCCKKLLSRNSPQLLTATFHI